MIKTKEIISRMLVLAIILSFFSVFQVFAASKLSFDDNSITIYESPTHTNHSRSFTLNFSPDPTGTVTTFYDTDGECLLGLGGANFTDGGQVVSTAEHVVFSVMAVDDEIGDGTHSCVINYRTESSADPNWDNITKTQVVSVIDNGDVTAVPHYTATRVTGDSVAEGTNNTVSYAVRISQKALDPVTIYASSGSQCDMWVSSQRVDTASGTIQAGSREPVVFKAVAQQDSVFEGQHECLITHSASTNDTVFLGVTPPTFEISVIDDDQTYLQKQAEEEAKKAEEKLAKAQVGLLDYYDSNNDGLNDSEQPEVTSFINSLTDQRQAIVLSPKQGDCAFNGSVVVVDENSINIETENLHFPQGLYNFVADCDAPGTEVDVTILLDQLYSSDYGWLLRKIDENGELNTIANAVFANYAVQTGQITSITYTVTDGGILDQDGEVNGVIVDPVGLALSATSMKNVETLARLDEQTTSGSQLILYFILGGVTVMAVAIIVSQRKVQQWLYTHTPHHHVKPGPKIDRY
jgi:hypothetical protein